MLLRIENYNLLQNQENYLQITSEVSIWIEWYIDVVISLKQNNFLFFCIISGILDVIKIHLKVYTLFIIELIVDEI